MAARSGGCRGRVGREQLPRRFVFTFLQRVNTNNGNGLEAEEGVEMSQRTRDDSMRVVQVVER